MVNGKTRCAYRKQDAETPEHENLPRATEIRRAGAPGRVSQLALTSYPYFRQIMRRAARLPTTALRHAASSSSHAHVPPARLASTSASPLQTVSGELGPHMTFMPPPLPEDSRKASGANDAFFPDTAQQDLRAVMNACLHAGYDVRRALAIFDEMRQGNAGTSKGTGGQVEVAAYNRVIAACLDMIQREPHKAVVWLDDALEYIRILHDGTDGVAPSAGTYALALQAWVMYGPDSHVEESEGGGEGEGPESVGKLQSDVYLRPKEVLRGVVRHDLAVEEVVSDIRINDDAVRSPPLSFYSLHDTHCLCVARSRRRCSEHC